MSPFLVKWKRIDLLYRLLLRFRRLTDLYKVLAALHVYLDVLVPEAFSDDVCLRERACRCMRAPRESLRGLLASLA
jgi:hypothetical protein